MVPLYPYTLKTALDQGEAEQWGASYTANCECKAMIERGIPKAFQGKILLLELVEAAVKSYGFDRLKFVLSNTLQLFPRMTLSEENKSWLRSSPSQPDIVCGCDRRFDYAVNCSAHMLNFFVAEVKQEYQKLGLFDLSHCEADAQKMDYERQILVLNPEVLKEECKCPENQLFYADIGGFGCSPDSCGRAVMGHFLFDGERATFNRQDFLGIIRNECLPDWAREKLESAQTPREPMMT